MASASPQLDELFKGFHDPRRYYTQIPDYLLDFLMPDLSGSELKVVYYVARHTFGFLRDNASISWSRFLEGTVSREGKRLDWGAGVSRRALKESLDSLADRGMLLKERQSSARRGDEASLYSLRLRPHNEEEPPRDLIGHWGFRLMPHSTGMPNQLFDVLLPHLTEGELKTISYIIRRTLGMKEDRAEISYSQFTRGLSNERGRVLDRGTGLSERTVQNALTGLVLKRCIERLDPTAEQGPAATYAYHLRTVGDSDHVAESITRDSQEVPHGSSRKYHTGVEESSTGMGSKKYHTGVAESITHEKQYLKTEKDSTKIQQHLLPNVEEDNAQDVVVILTDLGVTRKTARELTRKHSQEQIRTQIDMLSYRSAENPAAVLVKAIREDWAPPPGYETPQQREARTRDEETDQIQRAAAAEENRRHREGWPERIIERHGIDQPTLELWSNVQQQLPRLIGRGAYQRVLAEALLEPPANGHATVLVPSIAHKLQLGSEHRQALERVLHAELGREVRVEVRYAP